MNDTDVAAFPAHPLLRHVIADRRPEEMCFQVELRAGATPLLRDHRLFGVPLFPAAAYLDVALAAVDRMTGCRTDAIADAVFYDLLVVPDNVPMLLRIRVTRRDRVSTRFSIESASASDADPSAWRRHADGAVEHDSSSTSDSWSARAGTNSILNAPAECWSGDEFYARADRGPFQWRATHRVVRSVRCDEARMIFSLGVNEDADAPENPGRLHPTLIDGCLQVPAIEMLGDDGAGRVAVPSRIDRICLAAANPRHVSVHCRRPVAHPQSSDDIRFDLSVFDEASRPVAVLEGIRFRSISREVFLKTMASRHSEPVTRPRVDQAAAASGPARTTDLVVRLTSAPPSQRLALLAAFIERNVTEILKLKQPSASDLERGFFAIGLDSLLAIELQFRLQKALGFVLPPGTGLSFDTIEELSRHLLEEVVGLVGVARGDTPTGLTGRPVRALG